MGRTGPEGCGTQSEITRDAAYQENLEYVDYVKSARIIVTNSSGNDQKIYTIADQVIEKEAYEMFTSAENHVIEF